MSIRPMSGLAGSLWGALSFILYVLLCNEYIAQTRAQGTGLDDLPTCAVNCAQTAAAAIGCSLQNADTTCLCSARTFIGATEQCAASVCPVEDISTLHGVLDDLCSAFTTITTSTRSASTSSTSRTSSQTSSHSTSPTTTPSASSSTALASSTPSPSPTLTPGIPIPTASSSPPFPSNGPTNVTPVGPALPTDTTSSLSGSTTTTLVQTVTLPQSTVSGTLIARGIGRKNEIRWLLIFVVGSVIALLV
ncbi:hypothetical protein BDN70DRAFT_875559 [Pholiota conissans]|uniref:CFEM domain-containing protein n=1 Tax=Pholiota conissans TaxID=109636 RepID=A0A9P5Z6P1_9AGAR|nr:hypothetical protein BDN70DRAFT_875559 [Pholiota conissans]